MPRRSLEVAPPSREKEKKSIKFTVSKRRVRVPLELRKAALARKAGPMGGAKKEISPFAYNRGHFESETRELLEEEGAILSPKEKLEKIDQIKKEFALWSGEETGLRVKNFSAGGLSGLIEKELAELATEDEESIRLLESWIKILKTL